MHLTTFGLESDPEMLPMQPGDVAATYADVSDLERNFGFWSATFGFRPRTGIEEGVRRFVGWYREL